MSKLKVLLLSISFFLIGFNFTSPYAAEQCEGVRNAPNSTNFSFLIEGGWPGKLKNWPGQASLRIHNPDRKESLHWCGGTLISQNWLLTAAHCFKTYNEDSNQIKEFFQKDPQGQYYTFMENWEPSYSLGFRGKAYLEVVYGIDDLKKITYSNVRKIKQIINHPDYKGTTSSGHDIALVELENFVDVDPTRLAAQQSHDPQNHSILTMVSGFGDQYWLAPAMRYDIAAGGFYAAGSDTLREVNLPIFPTADCKKLYPGSAIGKDQICAGYKEGGKDSCQGDSGGPLVAFDKNGCSYQIGIVSWGIDCALKDNYGIYTRISSFIPWIKKYVPNLHLMQSGDIP